MATEQEILEALWVRIGNGTTWLAEHDPDGVFRLWWESGLTPGNPMPAQTAEVRDRYRAYYNARRTWERLNSQADQLEKKLRKSGSLSGVFDATHG